MAKQWSNMPSTVSYTLFMLWSTIKRTLNIHSFLLLAESFVGVYFTGGASLALNFFPSAKDAALQTLLDIPLSSCTSLVFLIGTHFRDLVVMTVCLSPLPEELLNRVYLALAIRLLKLSTP